MWCVLLNHSCVLNKRMPFRVHSFHGNNARGPQSCM